MNINPEFQGMKLAFWGIFIACIYYFFWEKGFLVDVSIRRMTKRFPKYGVLVSYLDMWIAYSLFMILFLYLIYKFNFFIDENTIHFSNESIIILGFSLLFLGRLIFLFQGENFFRNYITGVYFYRVVFLTFVSDLVVKIPNMNLEEVSLLYYNDINNFLEFYNGLGPSFFFGTILLVGVSETLQFLCKPKVKTLNDLSSLVPSGFQPIKRRDLNKMLNEIIEKDNIIKIRIVSNSNDFIDWILEACSSKELQVIRKTFIIRAHHDVLVSNFKSLMETKPATLGDFINYKTYKLDSFFENLSSADEKLSLFMQSGYLTIKYHYLGCINLLIIESTVEDNNKVLITFNPVDVYDEDPIIYSQQPYIWHNLKLMFDDIWGNLK